MLIHYLADFALQTNEQAINKSTSNKFLFYHVMVYSLIWVFAIFAYTNKISLSLCFGTITFFTHYCIDWCTSRLEKKYFTEKDYHNGFLVLGFDQFLHYIQLFGTYLLLMNNYNITKIFP